MCVWERERKDEWSRFIHFHNKFNTTALNKQIGEKKIYLRMSVEFCNDENVSFLPF